MFNFFTPTAMISLCGIPNRKTSKLVWENAVFQAFSSVRKVCIADLVLLHETASAVSG